MWIWIGAKKRRKKRKRNELRFGENVTLTLTSIPTLQIGSIRTQKRTKSDGEEGEGVVYLAVRRGDPLPTREKKTEPGELSARARPKKRRGQAARRRRAHPLGSAHAGEGGGDGAGARCSLSPSKLVARLRLRCAEREESGVDGERKERTE